MRVHLVLKTPTANTTPEVSPRHPNPICPPLDLSKWTSDVPRLMTTETGNPKHIHQLTRTPKPTARTIKTQLREKHLDMSPTVVQVTLESKKEQMIESKYVPNLRDYIEPAVNSLVSSKRESSNQHTSFPKTLRRPITSHNTSTVNPRLTIIKRLANPSAKLISVALPFANFDLFQPEWWEYYEGECVGDVRHGHGLLQLTNGEKYIGSFMDGKANGNGTFYRLDGQLVFAVWKDNRILKRLL